MLGLSEDVKSCTKGTETQKFTNTPFPALLLTCPGVATAELSLLTRTGVSCGLWLWFVQKMYHKAGRLQRHAHRVLPSQIYQWPCTKSPFEDSQSSFLPLIVRLCKAFLLLPLIRVETVDSLQKNNVAAALVVPM